MIINSHSLLVYPREFNTSIAHFYNLSLFVFVFLLALFLNCSITRRNLVDVESKVSDMRSQLIARDKELAATKAELKELSRHLSSLESEHSQCTHEKSAARKELIALKELCEKLDNEKDKLNAEVTEYADVRREVIQSSRIDSFVIQIYKTYPLTINTAGTGK